MSEARVKIQCFVTEIKTFQKWDHSELEITLKQLVKTNPIHINRAVFPQITICTPNDPESTRVWFNIYKERRIINMFLEVDEEKIP
jgi:hypothetical protein